MSSNVVGTHGSGENPSRTLEDDFTADSLQLNVDAGVSVVQGQFAWNADEETFDFGCNGAVLQGGQEVHYHVRNASGADISDGTPVMYNSADGTIGNSGRMKIVLMDGTSPSNNVYFMGIATESIPNGEDGKVTHFGKIRGIDTTGSNLTTPEVWADGDVLFVSSTVAGELTKTQPSSPALALPVASVIHAHSSGSLFVRATQKDEQLAWGDRVGGDYIDIESGGTIDFHGDASLKIDSVAGKGILLDTASPDYGWHDMIGEITIRGVAATDPTFATYNTGLRQYQFDVNDTVTNTYHILHDQAPNTDVYIHTHWSHNSASVTTGSVTWQFTIYYAKGHDQAPFTSKTISVTQDASTTQYQHMIAEVAFTNDGGDATHFDKADIETDGLLMVTTELTANTMDGGAKPFLHYVDIHYQSTGLPTKNKAPNFYT